MTVSFKLILLLVALSVAQVFSAVVREKYVAPKAEFRAATVTSTVTTTANGATTITKS